MGSLIREGNLIIYTIRKVAVCLCVPEEKKEDRGRKTKQ